MAARKTRWHPESIRQKIRAGLLAKRLEDFAFGRISMEKSQVTAAVALLDRCVPRLTSTEMKVDGEMRVGDIVDRPPRETYDDWSARRQRELASLHTIAPAGSAE